MFYGTLIQRFSRIISQYFNYCFIRKLIGLCILSTRYLGQILT